VDTALLAISPCELADLLALSLGLSQLHEDDQHMLQAALPMYDALYAWCRKAQRERQGGDPNTMRGVRP
jgi:hypothetical protein